MVRLNEIVYQGKPTLQLLATILKDERLQDIESAKLTNKEFLLTAYFKNEQDAKSWFKERILKNKNASEDDLIKHNFYNLLDK